MNRRGIAFGLAGARDARKMYRHDYDSPELRERIDRTITARRESALDARIQEMPEFKGFL
jgi:hypothetical protein